MHILTLADSRIDTDAQRLAHRLDGLPLALATAGVYIGQTSISCTEYLQTYETAWTDLHGFSSEELLEYEGRTLSSTWAISFEQVRKLDADAADLLKFLAYFSDKDIWYELIRTGADGGPAWMSRVTVNKLRFDRGMTKLQDYSLVEVTAGSYSIHPCIHDWISEHFHTDQNAFAAALHCVAGSIPDESHPQYWTITRRLLSHVDRLSKEEFRALWETHGSNIEVLFDSHDLGNLLFKWEQLEAAGEVYVRALTGKAQILGWNDPSTLSTAGNLGSVYMGQGKLNEAEEMFQRVLAGKEQAYGRNHALTLETVQNLGVLYMKQGKLDEAEKMLEEALVGDEQALGKDHMSTLDIADNLGKLYEAQDKLDKAEEMYLRVLKGKEQTLGGDNTRTLGTVFGLGNLYRAQGKLTKVEEMYLRVLKGTEQVLRQDSTLALNTLNNLGILYTEQGKLDAAEETLKQALLRIEQAYGTDRLETLTTVYNLGYLCAKQGRLAKAEELYSRALAGYEQQLSPDHITLLRTVNSLGYVYLDNGKLAEADESFCHVLRTYQDSDIKVRWAATINKLTVVLSKRTRDKDRHDAKRQLARLVRHIGNWGWEDSGTIYWLARALFWIGDEENFRIAFSKLATVFCVGRPDRKTDTALRGHHVCRQCDEVDLCNKCMARYRNHELTLPNCSGHEFLDVGATISKWLEASGTEKENQDIGAWIVKLQEKYPFIASET